LKKNLIRIGVVASLALLTLLIVIPKNSPKTHVEAPKSAIKAEVVPSTTEAPKTPETAPTAVTEPIDVVTSNPQSCNKDTQWIWSDGSCHDKEVTQVQTVAPVQRSSGGCDELRGKLLALGVGDYEIDSAITLAGRESSCNEYAQNPGGACGYFQSLPCGKWGMPGSESYLVGAIAYARAVYGDYNNALAHSYSHNWY